MNDMDIVTFVEELYQQKLLEGQKELLRKMYKTYSTGGSMDIYNPGRGSVHSFLYDMQVAIVLSMIYQQEERDGK